MHRTLTYWHCNCAVYAYLNLMNGSAFIVSCSREMRNSSGSKNTHTQKTTITWTLQKAQHTHTHTHFAKKFACTGVWLTRSFWFAEWLETHQPPQLVDAWTSRTLSMFKDKHFGCCKDIGLSDLVVQTQLDEILKCAGGDRRCWRKRKGRA